MSCCLQLEKAFLKYILVIVFFLVPFIYAQAQTDERIINDLFFDLFDYQEFDLIGDQPDTMLVRSRIRKTYFDHDSTTFANATGLRVPGRIISEWKKNMEPDKFTSSWNEKRLNELDRIYTGRDTIVATRPYIKCLSKREEDLLFEKSQERQHIYMISKILFDDARENAVLDFSFFWRPGSGGGHTVVIKKVFGKWIVVATYGTWIS